MYAPFPFFPDSHLAAIASETQSELHSNDLDFARSPGLRWRDPLE
jgi:predicted nucleic acid-binding protein